jgi:hypothetical protein
MRGQDKVEVILICDVSLVSVCVCVSWPPVRGGVTVKHSIPLASDPPQWHPLHPLGLIVLPPLDPQGGLREGFPTSPCILVLGLRGNSCWAVPQPRLFCPNGSSNTGILDREKWIPHLHQHETVQTIWGKGEQFDTVLQEYRFHITVPQCKGVEQKIGYLSCMGKRASPTHVARKHRHGFYAASLNWWLLVGKIKRHGWAVCKRQAD